MKRKITTIFVCMFVVIAGIGTASAINVATVDGLGSLFQFVGDGVDVENTALTGTYVKCVMEANDGYVFPMPGKSSLGAIYTWGSVGNIMCVVANAADNQAFSFNYIKVRGYNGADRVPVLSYLANAKKGVRMGIIQNDTVKLVMDGQTAHYAAPPKYMQLPVVPAYYAGTVNGDFTDDRVPFVTRIHEYYPIWRANRYPTCITDVKLVNPFYPDHDFWVKGINNSSACFDGPALVTSIHGYGINQIGKPVYPTYSGSSTGWIKWQRGIPTAASISTLSAGAPLKIGPK